MPQDREIRNVKRREQNGVEMEKDESVFDFSRRRRMKINGRNF